MLKLIYDLKVGFNNCYVTLLDDEFEISDLLAIQNEALAREDETCEPMTEEEFYNLFKDDVDNLLDNVLVENGWGLTWEECTKLDYTKLFFSHLAGAPLTCVAGIWEPSRVRLVYDPDTKTSYYYNNAFTARAACELLNITKQQLHYYVKTGQIRKEYNPEKPKQFKYNWTDIRTLKKKLDKKYDRYKD